MDARNLDELSPADRALIDYHTHHLKEIEEEEKRKEIDIGMKTAQVNALNQIAALVGTGIKATIQKSIDGGELKETWDKLIDDTDNNPALALGKLLIHNTDECMSRVRQQAQVEAVASSEYRGVLGYLKKEAEKTKSAIETIWGQHERRKRMAEEEARPLPIEAPHEPEPVEAAEATGKE